MQLKHMYTDWWFPPYLRNASHMSLHLQKLQVSQKPEPIVTSHLVKHQQAFEPNLCLKEEEKKKKRNPYVDTIHIRRAVLEWWCCDQSRQRCHNSPRLSFEAFVIEYLWLFTFNVPNIRIDTKSICMCVCTYLPCHQQFLFSAWQCSIVPSQFI